MTDILKDHLFWGNLAGAMTGWLRTASEKEQRRCWIDDLIPSVVRRTNPAAEVSGTAWVTASIKCDFVAFIPWRIANRDRTAFEIASIEIDLERKTVKVVLQEAAPMPAKASPESEPSSS